MKGLINSLVIGKNYNGLFFLCISQEKKRKV